VSSQATAIASGRLQLTLRSATARLSWSACHSRDVSGRRFAMSRRI